jgi:response regulator RpfG family c-di-GMP phosphodiesterase
MSDAIAVVNEGQIFKFLTKPCPPETLIKAVNDSIRQYELIRAEKELLNSTLKGVIRLLIDILSVLNPEAFSKSNRIHGWVNKLAKGKNYENIWQFEVAAMLSQIGCVTLPTELLSAKYGGQILSKKEEIAFLKHIKIGSELIKKIPRLEGVAKVIEYQEKHYDGGGFPENRLEGKSIPLISRMLKVIIDFDDLTESGLNPNEALNKLQKNKHWYDPEILSILKTELEKAKKGVVIEIKSNMIETGMILVDDVKTKMGVLLIPKGYEITDILRLRVLNFSQTNNIKEPIKVLSFT